MDIFTKDTILTIAGAAMIAFGASSFGKNPRERISLHCFGFGIALIAMVG